jgi:hypothetical protein
MLETIHETVLNAMVERLAQSLLKLLDRITPFLTSAGPAAPAVSHGWGAGSSGRAAAPVAASAAFPFQGFLPVA